MIKVRKIRSDAVYIVVIIAIFRAGKHILLHLLMPHPIGIQCTYKILQGIFAFFKNKFFDGRQSISSIRQADTGQNRCEAILSAAFAQILAFFHTAVNQHGKIRSWHDFRMHALADKTAGHSYSDQMAYLLQEKLFEIFVGSGFG
ncbi:hypothetical protein SDC9_195680 [bioreactor metagenome]|uniref:Uncharacterized protein n=1 Tax=bioreactor metagenome TaxID=1076179 RepID=A0A645IAX7_9ZZZZ